MRGLHLKSLALGLAALGATGAGPVLAAGAAESLTQQAYVWQRTWTPAVGEAVRARAARFDALAVLAAEVSWKGTQPQLIKVALDYATLRLASCSVILTLRIGVFPGGFHSTGEPIDSLGELADALIREATAAGIRVRELQLDYDCPDAKLGSYLVWIQALRRRVEPVPLTITALPSWMGQPLFQELVRATDGYVLQVHSLERPKGPGQPLLLCDPAQARRAAARAAGFGVAFRIALPTYGYQAAFDPSGKFAGLSADGPAPTWPSDVRIQEIRSDPIAMAELIRAWTTNRPAGLQGILWYRLPVRSDALNWAWPALEAVMAGKAPRQSCRALARSAGPGLYEIALANDGQTDLPGPAVLRVRWPQARLIAGDGLHGFALSERSARIAELRAPAGGRSRLRAGQERVIGWLRLSQDEEVTLEMAMDGEPER